jgi:hypothetical protein
MAINILRNLSQADYENLRYALIAQLEEDRGGRC